jgi:hypothetical protein
MIAKEQTMRNLSIAVVSALALFAGGAALAQQPQSQASVGNGRPADITLPVCDRAHTDNCLELGQNAKLDRELDQAYPQCTRMSGGQRAACFNRADGEG